MTYAMRKGSGMELFYFWNLLVDLREGAVII